MKNIRKVSLFSLPLWVTAVLATSAGAKTNLTCTVVDETGKPVAKQEFVLTTTGEGKQKESKKKTDDSGKMEFKNVDDGAYQLKGELQGYVPAVSEPIQVSGGAAPACNLTVVTAQFANSKLQEIMQLLQAKKIPDAQKQAEAAVKMMPGQGAAHYVLAVADAYAGSDNAVTEAKKAADLEPDKYKDKVNPIQMQLLNVQAETDKQKRDYASAIKKYEAIMQLAPNDPTVFYNLAVTYAAAKDLSKALENIDKELAIKPDDAEAKRLRDEWDKQFQNQLNQDLKK